MHHRRASLLALLVFALALAAPAGASATALTDIGGFVQPVFVAATPGDATRLMVVQKEGLIKVVAGGVQSTFLDVGAAVPGGIQSSGEQGLLSMAFAPDYAISGRFYVYYTAGDGNSNNVDEFTVSANRSQATPASRRRIISIPHTGADTHNGGQVAFGPDGLLYLAPGDGGVSSANAQSTGNLLGKVLRIDPRGGPTYTSPPDNPYAGATPGADEILHTGLRNPYRFSFDRLTGDLIIGDVGAGTNEEVTLLPAGTPGGRNLGWPICEGPCGGSPPANYFAPALYYSQPSPRAVTGGVVVRDASLPELYGCYLYGDFYEGQVRATSLSAQAQAGHGPLTGLAVNGLAGFGQDNAGRVYVAALSGGHVYRLDTTGGSRAACSSAVPGSGGNAGAKPRPRLFTATRRRQRVLHNGGVIGYGRCKDEACRVAMSGRLRVGKLSYSMVRTVRTAGAKRVKLRVRLTTRARSALTRALRHHRRATVLVGYRARVVGGASSALKHTTVLVRR